MAKKNSTFSSIMMGLLVIVVIVRIGMIMSRQSSNNFHKTWDNTYLIWSIFFLCAIIGTFFWNKLKSKEEEESDEEE